jgi:hypothetical protein
VRFVRKGETADLLRQHSLGLELVLVVGGRELTVEERAEDVGRRIAQLVLGLERDALEAERVLVVEAVHVAVRLVLGVVVEGQVQIVGHAVLELLAEQDGGPLAIVLVGLERGPLLELPDTLRQRLRLLAVGELPIVGARHAQAEREQHDTRGAKQSHRAPADRTRPGRSGHPCLMRLSLKIRALR